MSIPSEFRSIGIVNLAGYSGDYRIEPTSSMVGTVFMSAMGQEEHISALGIRTRRMIGGKELVVTDQVGVEPRGMASRSLLPKIDSIASTTRPYSSSSVFLRTRQSSTEGA